MLKSERNKQEGHQVILLIYNNLRAVSKSIVMEITDPGQAGSAIAGKCNASAGTERMGALRHGRNPVGVSFREKANQSNLRFELPFGWPTLSSARDPIVPFSGFKNSKNRISRSRTNRR